MNDLTDRATIIDVEYRVLGPLSASVRGDPIKLGGRRQQMVLAVLLSNPNEVISQDRLIESVWAGHEPDSAKQTLHSYVSNLRKELGGGIDREGTGYVVHIDDDGLDSTRFEALVGRARGALADSPATALELATEALALWHGPAFGDLGGEPALTTEALRLEELRLSTIEIRVEADIAVGNHSTVIQELEALTTEHPFRERLWGFLMLSLYRAGRQADALRSYRELRGILGEELGIEPSAELQALEEQILTQDPALDFTASGSPPVDRAARGYELREMIRETKFGALFRAFQGSVGREVAVLKLDEAMTTNPNFVRRFEPEMRAASELEHPHLIPIYDFWRDPDGAYLVTAFPRGGVLREVLADEPWNLSSVVRIVDQISSALSYLHRNGFVHGSLGSECILLDDESNSYLSNVGLAALVPGPDHIHAPADDVAALAVLALSLLTGFEARPSTRISELRPDLAELDFLFSRALHDDPASRFQKPEELRRALRQATGADVVPSGQEVPTGSRRNPYKGLRAFKESEADDFHGRDALVEELVEVLALSRLVAVVGPSGSGKSSLVRAGLLPALRTGAIEGSTGWLIAEMFPGTHPFEELEAALIRVATERPSGLFDELTADRRGLARAAKRIIGNDEDQLVLVVDQFEELFSLVTSETNRRLFLDSLTSVTTDERSRIRVVVTLRADFFDQPLQYPEFAEVMSAGLVPISPPTEEGLTRAIAQPARGVGVDLQPGLVTRIIDDVRGEPGGLPLMQYALTELFNQRVNNTMTLAAYEQSGGVAGALANRADEIYSDLSDEGRTAARNLFLRLVNVDELADDTRRRVRQTELKGLGINQTILDDVIQQFGAFRLLSFDRDAATRTPTVEVAHEALIREWTRLRTWIDERREDLLIHRRIQVTVRDWEDSDKDPSYLLRGSRLEQALLWQERTDLAISDDEMTFIEASIEQERRDQAEHQALEEKAARRRKAVIGALAGGLIVAVVLGAIALDRAEEARVTAAVATARDLSSAAMLAVEEDPELAILLALEAVDVTDQIGLPPGTEAASALRDTLRRMRIVHRVPTAYETIEFSPDGNSVLTDDPQTNGIIRRWALDGTQVLASWDRGESLLPGVAELSDLEHSPSGDTLAVAWADLRNSVGLRSTPPSGLPDILDGAEMPAITLHDPLTLELKNRLNGDLGWYWNPTFSANGLIASYFFGLDNSRKAIVWDANLEDPILVLESERAMTAVQFIPGTDILVASYLSSLEEDGSETPGLLVATDVISSGEVWRIETPLISPNALAVSPDGRLAVISDRERRGFQIWDLVDKTLVHTGSADDPQTLTWSPDSSLIAASGNDGQVTILERYPSWHISLTLAGHDGGVFSTDFDSDSRFIASASVDGTGLIWDLSGTGAGGDWAIDVGGNVGQFFMGSDGKSMIVGTLGLGAQRFDLGSGMLIASLPLVHQFHFVPTNDLSAVAALQVDNNHAVLDTVNGEALFAPGDCLLPLAISQDRQFVVVDSSDFCNETRAAPNSQVVDLNTGKAIFDLGNRRLFKAMFSPSDPVTGESYLVVNAENLSIEIYRTDGFGLVEAYQAADLGVAGFLTLALDPEGRYLGLGTGDGSAVVIDVRALFDGVSKMEAVVFNREVGNGSVPQVRASSGGLVVSSDFAGMYQVFDMATGDKLFEIREPELRSQGAAQFTWDGKQLAYEDALGNIRFTPLDTYEVVAQAEAVLTRSLTDDECRQYLHTDGCVD